MRTIDQANKQKMKKLKEIKNKEKKIQNPKKKK